MTVFRKIPLLLRFSAFYLKELVLANLRVAHDALTPTHYMSPAIIGIPLDVKTDLEILLLVNLITMTPGTVSLDVSSDRRMLYLHVMYLTEPDQLRQKIKTDLECRVIELLR